MIQCRRLCDGLPEDVAAATDEAVDGRRQERLQVARRGQELKDALLRRHAGNVVTRELAARVY